jgi:hypothetical protein
MRKGKKNVLRAGIPKGINRITFLMYTQSKLIKKYILVLTLSVHEEGYSVDTLWYSCSLNIFFY